MLGDTISGHSIKHLLAALGGFALIGYVAEEAADRQRKTESR